MRKMPQVYVAEQARVSLAGDDLPPAAAPHVYTMADFENLVGRAPEHDDLDRLNCPDAGRVGHQFCGVCGVHGTLRTECGCAWLLSQPDDPAPLLRVAFRHNHSSMAVDLERIEGWPGLDAFPVLVKRLAMLVGTSATDQARVRAGLFVRQLLMELVQRGALVRSYEADRRWIYDGRRGS